MELKARTLTTEHTEESSAWSFEDGQGLGVRVIFTVVKVVNYSGWIIHRYSNKRMLILSPPKEDYVYFLELLNINFKGYLPNK